MRWRMTPRICFEVKKKQKNNLQKSNRGRCVGVWVCEVVLVSGGSCPTVFLHPGGFYGTGGYREVLWVSWY